MPPAEGARRPEEVAAISAGRWAVVVSALLERLAPGTVPGAKLSDRRPRVTFDRLRRAAREVATSAHGSASLRWALRYIAAEADRLYWTVARAWARYARRAASRYARSREDAAHLAEDMGQAAMVGLYEAAWRYDPGVGRFSTYAAWWIRCALRAEQPRIVAIPGQLATTAGIAARLIGEEGVTLKQAAELLDVTPERLGHAINALALPAAGIGSQYERSTDPWDTLNPTADPGPEERLMDEIEQAQVAALVREEVGQLPAPVALVTAWHYGIGQDRAPNLAAIAKAVGYSVGWVRVRLREGRALLRDRLEWRLQYADTLDELVSGRPLTAATAAWIEAVREDLEQRRGLPPHHETLAKRLLLRAGQRVGRLPVGGRGPDEERLRAVVRREPQQRPQHEDQGQEREDEQRALVAIGPVGVVHGVSV